MNLRIGNYMRLIKVLKKRYSCRSFSNKPIKRKKLTLLINSILHFPCAGGIRSLKIIASAPEDFKNQGWQEAVYNQNWIFTAPLVLVYIGMFSDKIKKYGERGRQFIYQETGHSAQNVCLMATTLGLGSCVIGGFNQEKADKLMNCEKNEQVIAFIPIGIPA